mmetsp:Transcript_15811/g.51622  ORF Transcript_15811/g.51622 Transcript_15811/m.51622 type:complete len:254 (+) Transcript_15811:306-1067(+)
MKRQQRETRLGRREAGCRMRWPRCDAPKRCPEARTWRRRSGHSKHQCGTRALVRKAWPRKLRIGAREAEEPLMCEVDRCRSKGPAGTNSNWCSRRAPLPLFPRTSTCLPLCSRLGRPPSPFPSSPIRRTGRPRSPHNSSLRPPSPEKSITAATSPSTSHAPVESAEATAATETAAAATDATAVMIAAAPTVTAATTEIATATTTAVVVIATMTEIATTTVIAATTVIATTTGAAISEAIGRGERRKRPSPAGA